VRFAGDVYHLMTPQITMIATGDARSP
jgi:hypothetical protein